MIKKKRIYQLHIRSYSHDGTICATSAFNMGYRNGIFLLSPVHGGRSSSYSHMFIHFPSFMVVHFLLPYWKWFLCLSTFIVDDIRLFCWSIVVVLLRFPLLSPSLLFFFFHCHRRSTNLLLFLLLFATLDARLKPILPSPFHSSDVFFTISIHSDDAFTRILWHCVASSCYFIDVAYKRWSL